MRKRGQSKSFLKAIRKQYGLGEFSKKNTAAPRRRKGTKRAPGGASSSFGF